GPDFRQAFAGTTKKWEVATMGHARIALLARSDRAAAGAAVAECAAWSVLRLGRAGLPVLRRVRAAGTGGRDAVDLCRAADPRVRLVAHRAVGRGVARRRLGGGDVAADRTIARPTRLAP